MANAANALKKEEDKKVVIKDINQYNAGKKSLYLRIISEKEKRKRIEKNRPKVV